MSSSFSPQLNGETRQSRSRLVKDLSGKNLNVAKPRRDVIRRRPDVILLRCAYNIRPVVEDDAEEVAVIKRDTLLAIAIPPGPEHPNVFEVPPPVFDVLAALTDWTDRSVLGAASEVDTLVSELAQHGLIEVRG